MVLSDKLAPSRTFATAAPPAAARVPPPPETMGAPLSPSPATIELASASAANIKRLLYPERIDQLFVEYTWHW
ncbi:hypothetical protein RRG08_038746 [Elysia crispata]|uniref:Uncharacterized protein n=1 Tax=Elysia crispata TaxID=231223 RepID=A0AAE0XZW7_9GAST|nr:hypothetical protein RRG08_038746 [Elysia crispata]